MTFMNTSLLPRHLIKILSLFTLASLANIVTSTSVSSMNVILNSGFEDDFNNWNNIGDTSIQNTFQGISPLGGNNQALITTSCPDSPFASGECFDTQNPTNFRQDDPNGGIDDRTFNFSGLDQADANGNNFGQSSNLQTFLGLGANSLNLPRTGGSISGNRTPKEGSAIQQTVTLDEPGIITFNWNYLTNDGTHPLFGNQDFSFVTIYGDGSNLTERQVEILGDSTGSITTPIAPGQTSFEKESGYQFFSSELLPPGTYVVGAGVVDVDGTGISSGLLIDNFAVVPFDFTATTGLGLVAGLFGLSRLRRRWKSSLEDV